MERYKKTCYTVYLAEVRPESMDYRWHLVEFNTNYSIGQLHCEMRKKNN